MLLHFMTEDIIAKCVGVLGFMLDRLNILSFFVIVINKASLDVFHQCTVDCQKNVTRLPD